MKCVSATYVLVAFRAAEFEDLRIVAHKGDTLRWVARLRAEVARLDPHRDERTGRSLGGGRSGGEVWWAAESQRREFPAMASTALDRRTWFGSTRAGEDLAHRSISVRKVYHPLILASTDCRHRHRLVAPVNEVLLTRIHQHGHRPCGGSGRCRRCILRAYRSSLCIDVANDTQGRAGLVALRRARGGSSALGKAFYKGGFEKQMNRREAALILGTSYATPQMFRSLFEHAD